MKINQKIKKRPIILEDMKQNHADNKLNFEIKFLPEFTEKYNELNKIKLELNCLKEINEKQKNMLDFEIKKNEEFENIKKFLNLLILMLMF